MPNKNSEIIGIIPLTSDIGINPQSGNGTAVSLQLIGVGKRHGGVSSVALFVVSDLIYCGTGEKVKQLFDNLMILNYCLNISFKM